MNRYARDGDFGDTKTPHGHWVSLTQTHWGYVLRSDSMWSTRAKLIERVSATTGSVFLFIAAAHWMLPGAQAGIVETSEGMLATSMMMCVIGMIFIWIAGRGLCHELQVDMSKRCLRRIVRNRNGHARTEFVIPFDQIVSAYVRRPEVLGLSAELNVRTKCGRVLAVVSGKRATMEVLNERLSHDLNPHGIKVDGWHRVGYKLVPSDRVEATA